MTDKSRVLAHIIDVECQKRIAQPVIQHVPRIGDEIRLSGDRYYQVVKVVWPLDEDESHYARVNIGVKVAT